MQIIFDARSLVLYPVGKPGFRGGTEQYLAIIARGLAEKGHLVHVVTPDLEYLEHRGPTEFWWPPSAFPTAADVVVMCPDLTKIEPYSGDTLVLMTNCVDPWMGAQNELVSGVNIFPCFSKMHVALLQRLKGVPAEKCVVTGLGVHLERYLLNGDCPPRVPGRMLYANDPARGLWHLLDIFDCVRREIPHASLAIAYDFESQFERAKWLPNALAEMFWECRARIAATPGVRSLGALTPEQVTREQLACQVHVMPSDPPNIGSQIHGITQMECAAAGCALVLSNVEAFPEVFGDAATILPLPGTFVVSGETGARVRPEDWAAPVAELMQDEATWKIAHEKSLALAAGHSWQNVVDRWDAMLRGDVS